MTTPEPSRRGVFISIEGIDGAGKSTVVESVRRWIERQGRVVKVLREPGGTALGESLRRILLDPRYSPMAPWAEACLYAASQAQQAWETIVPSLERGEWILADRFRDATVAYQGHGRGLGAERILKMQEIVLGGLFPDITVLLDCTVATAWDRLSRRPGLHDRMEREAEDFMERVRRGYLDLARRDSKRFVVIDANRDAAQVLADVTAALRRVLPCNPAEDRNFFREIRHDRS